MSQKKYYLLPKFYCEVPMSALMLVPLEAQCLEKAIEEKKELPGGIDGTLFEQVYPVPIQLETAYGNSN